MDGVNCKQLLLSKRLKYFFLLLVFTNTIILYSIKTLPLTLAFSFPEKQSPVTQVNAQGNTDIMKILCVGICSLDTLATLNEFPTPDAKMRSTSLVHAGGGNAANTAVAISRLSNHISFLQQLNLKVDLLSAIGNDSNGDSIINGLKSENIGTKLIERFHGDSPWSYIMIVDDTRTILHQPSTRDLSVEYVKSNLLNNDILRTYSAVHFDLRHPQAAICVAEECKKLGIPYSVDVERPREGLLQIVSGASIIICNSNYVDLALNQEGEEIDPINRKVYNNEEIIQRFKMVLKEQAPCAIIGVMTMGSKGSCLVTLDVEFGNDDDIILEAKRNCPEVIQRDGALWCGTFENCEVVDTTGAGDVFQGGFVSTIWGYAKLLQNKMNSRDKNAKALRVPTSKNVLSHALRIASRVAAKKIEKAGSRDGIPRNDSFIESEFHTISALIDDMLEL